MSSIDLAGLLSSPPVQFIVTLLVAMVPFIELRGAIPIGVVLGLPLPAAVVAAMLGNMLPVPLIILFVRRVFRWLRQKSDWLNRFVTGLEGRGTLKSSLVGRYGMLGLCLLVAIPLPGTGAWTGSLVAAMLDMRLKRALPVIFLGVCIAALIVTCITCGVRIII